MNTNVTPLYTRLRGLGMVALIVGVIGALLGFVVDSQQILQSYLYAWVFWMCLTLGCIGMLTLLNILKANWGLPIIRIFEAGAKMLPLMAVLMLPILIFMPRLYPWAMANWASDPILVHRHGWMNLPFVLIRTVIYFVIWYVLANKQIVSARRQERNGSLAEEQRRTNIASPGFVVFVLTVTFAFTDWVMSLNGHWYSTIYGFWFCIGMGLNAMSFATLLTVSQANSAPYRNVLDERRIRDFGNMLIMMVMVWAYFSVSQFLIIWSGNLPEEISYYLDRYHGILLYVGAFLIIGQFFGPFVVLLSSRVKTTYGYLWKIAAWLFFIRIVDIYWTILPAFNNLGANTFWTAIVAFLAVGGLWLMMFTRMLGQNALFPTYDARLQVEAASHA